MCSQEKEEEEETTIFKSVQYPWPSGISLTNHLTPFRIAVSNNADHKRWRECEGSKACIHCW